jgi:hypothetical protein
MKKLRLVCFSLSLLFSGYYCQASGKKEIKKNKIKAVTETVTEVVDGKEKTYKKSFKKYDNDGNLIEDADFNADGSIKKKETFKFNSEKEVVEHVTFNTDGSIKKKVLKKYNGKNKIEELDYDGADKLLQKEVCSYNGMDDKVLETI